MRLPDDFADIAVRKQPDLCTGLHMEIHRCQTRLQFVTVLAAMICTFTVLVAMAALRSERACFEAAQRLGHEARWGPTTACEFRIGGIWTRATQ
ncbi:hypothetical protein [Methylovirgula sp. 4M-Z18]|uniref:hypothetical protein n=1 Tax=Methylovirgula sp. 4M-Z18 TaxID=2293567 RepID=UPI000E2FD33F|nr:hypothetical protein [Methylovirgula sp. 4M-Z18]RFB80437.1 hypothetical protein DYH55_02595 [Methylovirgula sp. 4M-Z18]